jgi:hypothetical protein
MRRLKFPLSVCEGRVRGATQILITLTSFLPVKGEEVHGTIGSE